MRLIDADKLIESICHTADLGGWIGDTLRNIKRLAVRYINSTPSIDIVRCQNCKHWIDDRKSEADMGICGLTHYFTNTDDFCSYGEREGE